MDLNDLYFVSTHTTVEKNKNKNVPILFRSFGFKYIYFFEISDPPPTNPERRDLNPSLSDKHNGPRFHSGSDESKQASKDNEIEVTLTVTVGRTD